MREVTTQITSLRADKLEDIHKKKKEKNNELNIQIFLEYHTDKEDLDYKIWWFSSVITWSNEITIEHSLQKNKAQKHC